MTVPSSSWYLYIIETEGGRLYTGITTDLARRFEQHVSGKGARFFRADPPLRMVYSQSHPDRSTASKAEYAVKQLSRKEKLTLIAGQSGSGCHPALR